MSPPAADALAGEWWVVGGAAGLATAMQTGVTVPMNTLQTNAQVQGLGIGATVRKIFSRGTRSGAVALYRPLPAAMCYVGMRHSLVFAGGSQLKKKLPTSWPEPARDAVSMASSALIVHCVTFPMDTVKTRLQMQMRMPAFSPTQLYQGFAPAVLHTMVGRGLWVPARNALEQRFNQDEQYWMNFLCGGVTSAGVTMAVFPLDTLKKRLQAAPGALRSGSEARSLMAKGGLPRFYRGLPIKVGMTTLQGACFNAAFVLCRNALERLERSLPGG